MPPKSAKNVVKDKKKVAEDKTFGLKNKNKSAKVSKYVDMVKNQAETSGNKKAMKEAEDRKAAIASKKAAEEAKKAELAELFKPVVENQKVPFGVDPKTLLCNFFKAGICQKGTKCKFSHDLNVERKVAKIDIYTDKREDEKPEDTMENWDDSKLADVVNQKQGDSNRNLPTEIVCKHFLEAIDLRKYGWFWECPNGGKACKYRHALPPGYVLKKKETESERREREANEKENAISFEEFLDTERHALGPNLTPITEETFMNWKKNRQLKQSEQEAQQIKQKEEAFKKFKAGAKSGMAFSGKELFDFNPDWAKAGDEDDGAMDIYEREASDHEGEINDPSGQYLGEDKVTITAELFEEDELAGLESDNED